MTDKELRKLGKTDLLELLISQMKENKRLNDRLTEANDKLNDRRLVLNDAGSIAEAALSLSGIFEMAQSAADQYLDNIKTMNQQEETLRADREEEAAKERERLLRETEIKCRRMEEDTRRRCSQIMDEFKADLQGFCEQAGEKAARLNVRRGQETDGRNVGQD